VLAVAGRVWFDRLFRVRHGGAPSRRNYVTGSPRPASPDNKLAVTDEKDLSTPQSPTLTNARIPRPDGYAGGPQDTETPAHQGARTIDGLDSGQATRLEREPAPRSRSAWSFGPADRLHRRAEYLRLQKTGARYQTAHFVMYAGRLDDGSHVLPGRSPGVSACAPSPSPTRSLPTIVPRSRLGMTVSRRIGSAVVRNRTRRRVRECYRLKLRSMFPDGTALIVIARSGAGTLKTPAIASELLHAATKLSARIGRQER
jgi:ribonuclease P protein component